MKVTYEHTITQGIHKGKSKIETFNITQRQLFLLKGNILSNELLDLYWGKDMNGEITISRKREMKTETKPKSKLFGMTMLIVTTIKTRGSKIEFKNKKRN